MPPETMTMVRPSTISPSSAVWPLRLASVDSSKKRGTMLPKMAIRTTSAMKGMMLSIHFLPRISPTTWSGKNR